MILIAMVLLTLAVEKAGTGVRLSATALVMGGTGEVLSVGPRTPEQLHQYAAEADRDFIAPSGLCVGGVPGCAVVVLYTPEQMRPFTGVADMTLDESVQAGIDNLDDCIRGKPCTATRFPYNATTPHPITDPVLVVQGESQSAIIASMEKADLIADPAGGTVAFVLVSNPGRPNGGLLERFVGFYAPVLGMSFNGSTPTDSHRETPLLTVDVARQYDGWVDFPANPLNLLAVLNAAMGAALQHHIPIDADVRPQLQGYYQDTAYYLTPSGVLPLVMPLAQIPVIGPSLAAILDAPLRVLVETGYDRTINPGQPTPARILHAPNPFKTVIDLAVAIPTGWDDAISQTTGDPFNRPFGTAPQPVYGVGGPPVYAGAVDSYWPVTQQAPQARKRTIGDSEIGLEWSSGVRPAHRRAGIVRPTLRVARRGDHRVSPRPTGIEPLSSKARRDLGGEPRPVEESIREAARFWVGLKKTRKPTTH